jgi:spermidine synthase
MLRFLVFLCFFLSGLTALIYEVVWARILVRVLGVNLFATAGILSIYMFGLGLGAIVIGRQGARLKNPLAIYALCELVIAGFGLLVPIVFGQSNLSFWLLQLKHICISLGIGSPELIYMVRFFLTFLLLLIPTFAMGATFPLITAFLSGNNKTNAAPPAYAVNTLGAACGAIVCGFLLMPTFGLWLTSQISAAINIFAFCLSAWLASKSTFVNSTSNASGDEASTQANDNLSLAGKNKTTCIVLSVVALSSMLSMALELVWTRLFSLVLGSTTYSLSAVLFVFLLALALGAGLCVRFRKWIAKDPSLAMVSALVISAVYLIASLYLINEAPFIAIQVEASLIKISADPFVAAIATRFLLAIIFMLAPVTALGTILPIALAVPFEKDSDASKRAAKTYGISVIGSVCGVLLSGFLFMPWLGEFCVSVIQSMLIGIAVSLSAIAVALLFVLSAERPFVLVATFCAAITLSTIALVAKPPEWSREIMSSGASIYSSIVFRGVTKQQFLRSLGLGEWPEDKRKPEILFYREGLNTTVTAGREPFGNTTYLKNDGKVEASVPTDTAKPAPNSNYSTQILLALAPIAAHHKPVTSAFVIGYGSGTTLGALMNQLPEAKISVAELEKAVLDADYYFRPANGDPLCRLKSRSAVFVTDGRLHLGSHRTTYDVIISQPSDPWVSGMSDLYTREFYDLVSSRLCSTGVFCQWLPLYSITPEYIGVLCRTFASAFPQVMAIYQPGAGELILIGSKDKQSVSKKCFEFSGMKEELKKAQLVGHSLDNLIILDDSQLRKMCQSLEKTTGDPRLNTDDNLLAEFQLPPQMFKSPGITPENLKLLGN